MAGARTATKTTITFTADNSGAPLVFGAKIIGSDIEDVSVPDLTSTGIDDNGETYIPGDQPEPGALNLEVYLDPDDASFFGVTGWADSLVGRKGTMDVEFRSGGTQTTGAIWNGPGYWQVFTGGAIPRNDTMPGTYRWKWAGEVTVTPAVSP